MIEKLSLMNLLQVDFGWSFDLAVETILTRLNVMIVSGDGGAVIVMVVHQIFHADIAIHSHVVQNSQLIVCENETEMSQRTGEIDTAHNHHSGSTTITKV
jgi:hypothetical protein